ncbi:MAG: hypothetical protein U0905_20345 [Pirellulales bacterium]
MDSLSEEALQTGAILNRPSVIYVSSIEQHHAVMIDCKAGSLKRLRKLRNANRRAAQRTSQSFSSMNDEQAYWIATLIGRLQRQGVTASDLLNQHP